MKKFFIILLIILLIPTSAGAGVLVASHTNVKIFVDGQDTGITAYAINGFNQVPVAKIVQAMGGTTKWDGKNVLVETPKTDLEKVAADCKDSCVMIYVYKDGQFIGNGSGWVYSEYVITAKHVTDAGNSFKVFTDDAKYGLNVTQVVNFDTTLDVSALKIDTGMPSVKLGDSDKLKEGEELVSIACPDGAQNIIDKCVYTGVIYDTTGNLCGFSEASMTFGSSGGGVFNMDGEIIGMISSGNIKVKDLNIGIPINKIISILKSFK